MQGQLCCCHCETSQGSVLVSKAGKMGRMWSVESVQGLELCFCLAVGQGPIAVPSVGLLSFGLGMLHVAANWVWGRRQEQRVHT